MNCFCLNSKIRIAALQGCALLYRNGRVGAGLFIKYFHFN